MGPTPEFDHALRQWSDADRRLAFHRKEAEKARAEKEAAAERLMKYAEPFVREVKGTVTRAMQEAMEN